MRRDLTGQDLSHHSLPGDSFNRFAPALRVYCVRLLADTALADDAVQQTFEIAIKSYPSVRDASRIKAWLFSVARNECLRLLAQPRALPMSEEYPDDSSQSPVELTAAADIRSRVQRALDSLPPIYRQAVALRDMEGLAYAEIASLTGVSLASVKFRIFKGRELLMSVLGPVLKEWRTP
ncbi:MAG TPA: RNA polymerase sigma factor [Bacteroidota bacterium]|nr:RNA polymerase sigma factor [Bacteroidota bacterium]